MYRLMKKGLFPRVGLGRNLTPIVHVRDVVQAAVKAGDSGLPGETYLVASASSFPLVELRAHVLAACGLKRPYWYVPAWAMYLGAWFLQNVALVLGKAPVVSVRNVASTVYDREFSIDKARRDLGYEPEVDIGAGIEEMVRWLESEADKAASGTR